MPTPPEQLVRTEPFGRVSGDATVSGPATTPVAAELLGSSRLHKGSCSAVQEPANVLHTACNGVQPPALDAAPAAATQERSGDVRDTTYPESGCHGCGAPLQPNVAPGPKRKWCSQRCRKRTCYSRPCPGCGTLMNGSNGLAGEHAPTHCSACAAEHRKAQTRQWILDSFREWVERFGRPPVVAEWNPAMARQLGRSDYLEQHAATGRKWPSDSCVADHFGSWNGGVEAAGLTPCRSGNWRDETSRRARLREAAGTAQRRAVIHDLFTQGLTYRQIGERLGIEVPTVQSHVCRMRADGWDLPYRRAPKAGA